MKNWNVILSLLFVFHVGLSWAAPSQLTFQGRILKSDGTPLEYGSVSFIFQILDPSGSCLIYQEQVTGYNMVNSGGVFDVPIGSGGVQYPLSGTFTILDAFNNGASFSCGTCALVNGSYSCSNGSGSYPAADGDARKLRVSFYDGSAWKTISPDNVIRSVPFAGYSLSAQKLGTHVVSDFLLKTGLPTCATGTFLSWDGSSLTCASVSGANGGTVTNVTSTNSYLAVVNGATTPQITLNVGTSANTVAAGNDPRIAGALQTGASAGGDLSGNYPNPSVAALQGVSVSTAVPTSGQVLKYNGTNWSPSSLMTTDISNLSSTLSNYVSQSAFNGYIASAGCTTSQTMYWNSVSGNFQCQAINVGLSGDVTGSIGASKVVALQNQPVDAIAPTVNQVLQWNGSKWIPATLPAGNSGTVTSVATGTGLNGGPITSSGTISLADTTVTAGSYGSATQVPAFTVDAQGRLTAASNTTITPAWSSITSTPTTLAGYGITDSVKNNGGTPSIQTGTDTSKPASPSAGAIYFATDTNKIYQYNSGAWSVIASATGAGGTVTSVGVAVPTYMTSSGGPVTNSGTITLGFGSQSAKNIFAAPQGAAGAPTFRTLNIADIQSSVSGNFLTGSSCSSGQALSYSSVSDTISCLAISVGSGLSGVVPVANGGTNSSTALNNNRLMVSSGGAIVEAAAMTDGQIVVGKTSSAPQLVTMSGDATVSNAGALTLASSGVIAGTYKSVTVDAKGRVTAGTNPTTLSGFGITDGVQNAGGAPSIQTGTDASKPASPSAGAIYFATDTNKIYQYNSGAWAIIASANGSGGTITALTGDVSASGAGSVAATVNSMGGSTAANVHSAELAANAATNANTASTIVKRDASGNFSAGTITASLTGAASLNVLKTGDSMSGNLTHAANIGDIYTAGSGANTVTVEGPSGAIGTSYVLRLPTAQGAANQLMINDGSGNLSWTSLSSLGVTSVAVTSPITNTGTASVPNIGIQQATTSQSGYLSNTDWNTFNNKQSATLNSANIWVGNGSNVATAVAPSGDVTMTNAGAFTVAKIQGTAVSSTAPSSAGQVLRYNGTTQYAPAFLGLADIKATITPFGGVFASSACTAGQTLYYQSSTDTFQCQSIAINDSQLTFSTSRSANTFLAAPNGSAGAASFRTMVAADLPTSGVAAGTYKSVTVDTYGRVTAATNPTTLSGFGITDGVQNAGNAVSMQTGADASKTAAGTNGRFYFATDTQKIYFDNGSSWIQIASNTGSGGTVTNVATGTGLTGGPISSTGTISIANTTVTAGSYGSATQVATFTVNAQGQLTAAGNTSIAIPWSAITSGTPTTLAGYGITDSIKNNGGTPSIQTGLDASKPASPSAGAIYFATDTNKIYQYNSSAWAVIASATGSGGTITALTGDVSASGSGSVAATVNSVGGSTAANVHTAELAANAATNANTASTIVKRDASGNFSAGTITASLTGAASLNVLKAGDSMSGNLTFAANIGNIYTAGSGANTVTVEGPSGAIGTSYVLRLPAAQGAANQLMINDGSGNLSWTSLSSLGVTSVSVTSPITNSGTASVPNIGIQQATTSQSGYLSSTDWNTFNNKQSASLASANIWVGNASNAATAAAPSGDVSMTNTGSFTVTAIRGKNVSTTAPSTAGQVLRYDGTNWTPNFISMFDLRSTVTGAQTFGGGSTGCTAGQTLTWTAATDNLSCTSIAITSSQVSFGSQTANTIFAAPNGSAGAPTFRSLASTDLPTSGVSSGSYGSATAVPVITVDSYGRVTAASTTTISGVSPVGASLASSSIWVGNSSNVAAAVSVSGDATLSNSGVLTLASSGVTAGTYTSVTVNAKGVVTAGTNPTTVAGYGITDAFVNGGNSFGGAATLGTNDNYSLGLKTNGSTRMTIDTSGNVGISAPSPGAKLDVNTTGSTLGVRASSSGNSGPSIFYNSYSGALSNAILTVGSYMSTGSSPVFNVESGMSSSTPGSGTSRLTVTAAGNVGIGTTSPISALDVNGHITSDTGHFVTNFSNGALVLNAGPSSAGSLAGIHFRADGTLGNPTAASEMMFVSSSGYVGIGTTSPSMTLDVMSSGNAIPMQLRNSNHSSSGWTMGPDLNNAFVVYNSGNVGAYISNGSTSWTASSDIRLKKDFQPLENALEKVQQITGMTYHYKTDADTDPRRVGVIAQDVQKVLPEAVTERNGFLGVKYTELIPLVINAVKELHSKWTSDHQDLASIKAEVETLKVVSSKKDEIIQNQQKQIDQIKNAFCDMNPAANICGK